MKKNHIREFMVKLLALSLAILMAFPSNVFASMQRQSNYNQASSVMGDAKSERSDTNILKSEVTTDETTDYIVEKSATLSKSTGQIAYRIAVKSKSSVDQVEKLMSTFAVADNTDLKDLKVDKVRALDENNSEVEIDYENKDSNESLDSDKSIDSLSITTEDSNVGLVYYLSGQLDQEKLESLEEDFPKLALDMVLTRNDNPIYESRYSLETQAKESEELLANEDIGLDDFDNISLVKGLYKDKDKKVSANSQATITWSDYILSSDAKSFTYDFNLDRSQNTDKSKIKIDFYQATNKGFVLNEELSQEVPFTKSINLSIPQGQIARLEVSTRVKEDTNSKTFSYNDTKIINPSYKEEKNEDKEAKADKIFSKNKSRSKPSNHIIADKDDQDFSRNSKSEKSISAIELNRDSLLTKYKKEDKVDKDIEESINQIANSLKAYNDGKINWQDFVKEVKKVTSSKKLEKSKFEDIIKGLIAGLNEDSYKVSNINLDDLTKNLYINVDSTKEKDLANADHKDSSNPKSEKKKGVIKKNLLTNQLYTKELIADNISKKMDNDIRSSVSVKSKAVNTYEKAYIDYLNNDLSYYIYVRPEELGRVAGPIKFDIRLSGNGKIDSTKVYRVEKDQREDVKSALENKKVLPLLNNLDSVDNDKGYVRSLNSTDNKANITFSNNKFLANSTDTFLIKVKAKEVKPNEDLNFSFAWTSDSGNINLLNNPMSIKTNAILKDKPAKNSQNSKNKNFPLNGNGHTNHVNGEDEYGDFDENVFCIQIERQEGVDGPARREKVTDGSEVAEKLSPRNYDPLGKSPYKTNEELTKRLKKAFYYAGDYQNNEEDWEALQAAIYYVVGGSTADGTQEAHEYKYLNGNPGLSIPAKSEAVQKKANDLIEKVKADDNWDEEKEDSVELWVFETQNNSSQNGIWGKVKKDDNPKENTGEFSIVKKDADTKKPLADAHFQLFDESGNKAESEIVESDSDGKTQTFKGLVASKVYTLKEIDKVEGYKESDVTWKVTVDDKGNVSIVDSNGKNSENNVIEYTITNTPENEKPKLAEINIFKTNKDKEKLDDANFKLTSKDDESKVWQKDHGKNGIYTFEDIPVGKYTLEETKAPAGHILAENENERKWDVEVYESDEGIKTRFKAYKDGEDKWKDQSSIDQSEKLGYTIVNEKEKEKASKFAIKKVDSENKEQLLEGAEFTLTGGDLSEDIVKTTSKEENPLIFDNLKANKEYKLKETKAPSGYKNENLEWNVKVDQEGAVSIDGLKGKEEDGVLSFTIENTKEESKTGKFEILKVDDSDKKLDNAEFTLYKDSDLKDILTLNGEEQVKLTADGQITFDNLPESTYYLKETKAPDDYITDSTIWTVSVKDGVTTISSENKDNKNFEITNSDNENTTSQLKAINHKATYPSTGGSGPKIVFAIAGTALMLLALMYYGIYQNGKNYKKFKN